MKREKITILILVFMVTIAGTSAAQETIPHTFEAGGMVSASQMNENFQALAGMINGLVPVGTLIASMLTPVQMFSAVGDTWKLADGSAAPAAYVSATGSANLPDLRGVFLRGLNESRGDGYEDPDGASRVAGDSQMDQFQGHYHDLGSGKESDANQGYIAAGGVGSNQSITDAYTPITDGTNGTPRIGSETRPKNVAVYYYVKVE